MTRPVHDALAGVGGLLAAAAHEDRLAQDAPSRDEGDRELRELHAIDRVQDLIRATAASRATDLAGAALQVAAALEMLRWFGAYVADRDRSDSKVRIGELERAITRLLYSALSAVERDARAAGADLEAIGLTPALRAAHLDPWRWDGAAR